MLPTAVKAVMDEEVLSSVTEAAIECNLPSLIPHLLHIGHSFDVDINIGLFENLCEALIAARHWGELQAVLDICYKTNISLSPKVLNAQLRMHLHTETYSALQMKEVERFFGQHACALNRDTYNVIVEAYIANRDLQGCRKVVVHMENAGFPINEETQRAVLFRLVSLGPNEALEGQIFASLQGMSSSLDVELLNSLIRLRSMARDDGGVRRYLLYLQRSKDASLSSNLPNRGSLEEWNTPPDISTISILIEHFARRQNLQYALMAFSLISEFQLKPSPEAVAHMIYAYGRCHQLQKALALTATLFSKAFPRRITRSHSLLTRLGWDGSPHDEGAPKVVINTYILNSLLRALLPSRGLDAATIILDLMKVAFVTPDSDTAQLILSFIEKHEHLHSAALNRVLFRLAEHGSTGIHVRHMNTVLHALLRERKRAVARGGWQGLSARLSVNRAWRAKRTAPVTLERVKQAFSLLGDSPTAGSPGDITLRRNWQAINPNENQDHTTYALRMCYHARVEKDAEAVERLYDEMLQKNLKPNAYHVAALIEAYCNTRQLGKARGAISAAYADGVTVNRVLYTLLIQAYGDHGHPDAGRDIYHSMLADGVIPDIASLEVLVRGYFVAQDYQGAKNALLEFWHTVLPPNTIPPPKTSLSRALWHLRKAEHVLKPPPPKKGPQVAPFAKGLVTRWRRTQRNARLREPKRAISRLRHLLEHSDGRGGEKRGSELDI